MIPTHFKSKLRKSLSYPVGAEAISEAFAALPKIEDIKLYFSAAPIFWKSEFDKLLREKKPYCIFKAAFRFEQRSYSYFYPSEWTLTVYPVLRELRHVASELLQNGGLATAVEYMGAANAPGCLNRSHAIELIFDPTTETLAVERHD